MCCPCWCCPCEWEISPCAAGAEYVGCFKIRNAADERLAQRSHRWYDPHHKVFLGDDTRYAEGPFYVIHGRVIEGVMRSGLLPRAGGPEGTRLSPALPQVSFGATEARHRREAL